MGIMGGILKGAGVVVGTAAKYGIKATGSIVCGMAELADNSELAEKSRRVSNSIGNLVGSATMTVANGAGYIVDKSIELGAKTGGEVSGFIAKLNGADDEKINKAKIVGQIVGGGAIGLVTGDLIGTAVVGVVSATGVASTGVAISALHGAAETNAALALIGGGTLAAGGGGIAAGQAILTGINATSTLTGSIDGVIKNNKRIESFVDKEIIPEKVDNSPQTRHKNNNYEKELGQSIHRKIIEINNTIDITKSCKMVVENNISEEVIENHNNLYLNNNLFIPNKIGTSIIGSSNSMQVGMKKLKIGEKVNLIRDLNNIYDKYALAVYNESNEMLGYIAKDSEEDLSIAIDNGIKYEIFVTSINRINSSTYADVEINKID